MALAEIPHAGAPVADESSSRLRVVPDLPAPGKRPVAGATLDLDPLLVRYLGRGVLGGVVVALACIAIPLTVTMGWAYGLGVAGNVALWCGTGFGLIAGAAAYTARSHQTE